MTRTCSLLAAIGEPGSDQTRQARRIRDTFATHPLIGFATICLRQIVVRNLAESAARDCGVQRHAGTIEAMYRRDQEATCTHGVTVETREGGAQQECHRR